VTIFSEIKIRHTSPEIFEATKKNTAFYKEQIKADRYVRLHDEQLRG